jgi:hypothetical protein
MIHTDEAGNRYREGARCPWTELTIGDAYLDPTTGKVFIREADTPTPYLDRMMPGISNGLRNRTVIALEREE